MRLFGLGGKPEDPAAQAEREASLRSLEQGGLPLKAFDRLREQKSRQGTPGHIFTSDLSVPELALTKQVGYQPLGQVMGSSMYHVGWQFGPMWTGISGELEVLTQAHYQARHLAIGRLKQEASLLGATGVVGVRLNRKEYEWGSEMLEFAAIGTAIRESDLPPAGEEATNPFVSDLSGEDFWMLRQAGFRPVGFALGNCSYYQIASWSTRYATTGALMGGAWQNQELGDFTQAMYEARALAMMRMENEARSDGAVGIVGADVDVEALPREVGSEQNRRIDMLYHFNAVGTAIAPFQGRWPVFKITNTVSLS